MFREAFTLFLILFLFLPIKKKMNDVQWQEDQAKKNIELEANASHVITKTKKQRKYQIRNSLMDFSSERLEMATKRKRRMNIHTSSGLGLHGGIGKNLV
jgi:hypothetical protein